MRVKGLDGRQYTWKLTGYEVLNDDLRPRSSGHLQARALLKKLFPMELVLEEVHIPGCGTSLYFDFFLPARRLAVEVQGEQHRRFIERFHGSPKGFLAQRQRDDKKVTFCTHNNLKLAILHDCRIDTWERILRGPNSQTESGEGSG